MKIRQGLGYFSRAEWGLWLASVGVTLLAFFLFDGRGYLALTARRSSFYALAYAANDIVLLVLWILQAGADRSAVSVIVCFAVFLVNDLYGFLNWRRMEMRQNK